MHYDGPPTFEIVVTAAPRDGAVVAVAGEIDMVTAPDFDAALREHLAAGPVRLDLRGLSFMDSSGIRVLDAVLRELPDMRGTLLIEPTLQPGVRQVLALTGMTEALPFDGAPPAEAGP